MTEDNFKPIFETYNSADIAFLKSILNSKGINFVIENENYAEVRPLAGVPMVVKVRTNQLDEAKKLLSDFKGGKFGQGQV
ncbi:MAG: DUF2007 domain-containing protein [Candidatus Omnitrophota bacterium]